MTFYVREYCVNVIEDLMLTFCTWHCIFAALLKTSVVTTIYDFPCKRILCKYNWSAEVEKTSIISVNPIGICKIEHHNINCINDHIRESTIHGKKKARTLIVQSTKFHVQKTKVRCSMDSKCLIQYANIYEQKQNGSCQWFVNVWVLLNCKWPYDKESCSAMYCNPTFLFFCYLPFLEVR